MPTATRASWKGHLRLSLVSIGVELYTATESASQLPLHQIHKPSGQRIRYEKVVPGKGAVAGEDIVKGYEIEKNTYVTLEEDELDKIRLESKRTIDLVQFVAEKDLDPRYYEKPYYVAPDSDVAAEGFCVIREALGRSEKVGLGKMAMRGRESLVAVRPLGRGLLLETLRYGNEIRNAEKAFAGVPEMELDEDMVSLASELIERKTAPFDPLAFHDTYSEALRELIDRKMEGRALVQPEEGGRARGQVIDLMAALKKSVQQDKGKGEQAAKAKARRSKEPAPDKAAEPPRKRKRG
jgi:DNA end-binding protein Ku